MTKFLLSSAISSEAAKLGFNASKINKPGVNESKDEYIELKLNTDKKNIHHDDMISLG